MLKEVCAGSASPLEDQRTGEGHCLVAAAGRQLPPALAVHGWMAAIMACSSRTYGLSSAVLSILAMRGKARPWRVSEPADPQR
jgi:hypothetical protein